MNYKVHNLEINMEGEVVSIISNIKKTSLFQIFGISAKVDFLFIVEKIR